MLLPPTRQAIRAVPGPPLVCPPIPVPEYIRSVALPLVDSSCPKPQGKKNYEETIGKSSMSEPNPARMCALAGRQTEPELLLLPSSFVRLWHGHRRPGSAWANTSGCLGRKKLCSAAWSPATYLPCLSSWAFSGVCAPFPRAWADFWPRDGWRCGPCMTPPVHRQTGKALALRINNRQLHPRDCGTGNRKGGELPIPAPGWLATATLADLRSGTGPSLQPEPTGSRQPAGGVHTCKPLMCASRHIYNLASRPIVTPPDSYHGWRENSAESWSLRRVRP